MKSVVRNGILGIMLAATLPMAALWAAEEAKVLPTLLIKGEVVSLDANDPAATLLKVKDRYGFETPIFLTNETKIVQGDKVLKTSDLTAGTAVEVEYNFDVNTAKRHAVSVRLAASTQAAATPATPAAAASPAAATPATATAIPTPAASPTPSAATSAAGLPAVPTPGATTVVEPATAKPAAGTTQSKGEAASTKP